MAFGEMLLVLACLGMAICQTSMRGAAVSNIREGEIAALRELQEQLTLCGGTVELPSPDEPCAADWIVCSHEAAPKMQITAGTYAIMLSLNHLSCSLQQLASPVQRLAQISQLHLPSNHLSGSLPHQWSLLSNLESLHLSSNNISGLLPAAYSSLSRLTMLDLSRNNLIGALPANLSVLTRLKMLLLHDNSIELGRHGFLPSAWGELVELEVLSLSNNYISGFLPPEFGKLLQLQQLLLDGNQLYGALPNEWSALASLKLLYLQGNGLGADLPSAWSVLSRLEELRLDNNTVVTSLPPEWSGLISMQALQLQHNSLTKGIPSSWSKLTKLTLLDLSFNNLTGPLPTTWTQLSSVAVLRFRSNLLNGSLPADWASMTRLSQLDLAINALTGPLPAGWSGMRSLVQLDVSSNLFVKSLPAAWSSLPAIQALNATANHLTSQLPDSWGNLKNLHSLSLESNNLTGPLPVAWAALGGRLKVLQLAGNKFTAGVDGALMPRQWLNTGPEDSLWSTLRVLSVAACRVSLGISGPSLADIFPSPFQVESSGRAVISCSRSWARPASSLAVLFISAPLSHVELSGWVFVNCSQPVLALEAQTFHLSNITATGNIASVIEIRTGTGSIVHSMFEGNSGHIGGAVSVQPGACLQWVNQSQFVNNVAREAGGALYLGRANQQALPGCVTALHTCVFMRNVAGSVGGGVFAATPGLQVMNCTWDRNTAGNQGGALAILDSANVSINSTSFTRNSAQFGGAVAILPTPAAFPADTSPSTTTGVLLVRSSSMHLNAAEPHCGGDGGDNIYAVNASKVWLAGCVMEQSQPTFVQNGEAVHLDSLTLKDIQNCLKGSHSNTSASVSSLPAALIPASSMRLPSSPTCNTSFSLELQAVDALNNTITCIPPGSELVAYWQPTSTDNTAVSGPTSAAFAQGKFLFSGLSICCDLGSTPSLWFMSKYFSPGAGPRVSTNLTLQFQILQCPLGAVAKGLSCVKCSVGSFSFNPQNRSCDICPRGAACDGWKVVPLPNHWHSHPQGAQVHRCLLPNVCCSQSTAAQQLDQLAEAYQQLQALYTTSSVQASKGVGWDQNNVPTPVLDAFLQGYWQAQCAAGHKGVLCGACKKGYGHNVWGVCVSCGSSVVRVWVEFALSLLPNALLLAGACAGLLQRAAVIEKGQQRAGLATDREQQAGLATDREQQRGSDVVAIGMCLVTHLQFLSLLPAIHVPAPGPFCRAVYSLGQLVAVSGGFGEALECGFSTAYSLPASVIVKLVNTFTPVLVLLLLWVSAAGLFLCMLLVGSWKRFQHFMSVSALLICTFYYVEVSRTVMSMLNCVQLESLSPHLRAAGWYWASDTTVKCGSASLGFGIPGVIAVVFGTPLLLGWLARTSGLCCLCHALSHCSFTNSSLHPFCFWEWLQFAVKALAVAAVTFPRTGSGKLQALLISLIPFLVALLWCWPYKSSLVNRIASASTFLLVASVLLLQLGHFQMVIFVVLAIAHLVLLIVIVMMGLTMLRGTSSWEWSKVWLWQAVRSHVSQVRSCSRTAATMPPTTSRNSPHHSYSAEPATEPQEHVDQPKMRIHASRLTLSSGDGFSEVDEVEGTQARTTAGRAAQQVPRPKAPFQGVAVATTCVDGGATSNSTGDSTMLTDDTKHTPVDSQAWHQKLDVGSLHGLRRSRVGSQSTQQHRTVQSPKQQRTFHIPGQDWAPRGTQQNEAFEITELTTMVPGPGPGRSFSSPARTTPPINAKCQGGSGLLATLIPDPAADVTVLFRYGQPPLGRCKSEVGEEQNEYDSLLLQHNLLRSDSAASGSAVPDTTSGEPARHLAGSPGSEGNQPWDSPSGEGDSTQLKRLERMFGPTGDEDNAQQGSERIRGLRGEEHSSHVKWSERVVGAAAGGSGVETGLHEVDDSPSHQPALAPQRWQHWPQSAAPRWRPALQERGQVVLTARAQRGDTAATDRNNNIRSGPI